MRLQHAHHRRQGGSAWNDFTSGISGLANELNPFGDNSGNNVASVQKKTNRPSTVYKTVFTTMSPTFEGAVGGYSTVQVTEVTTAEATTTEEPATTTAKDSATTNVTTKDAASTSLPDQIVPTSVKDDTTLAVATKTPTSAAATMGTATNADAVSEKTTAALASSTSSPSSSNGDTGTGARAGIAIGVLAALLVVGLLVFFVVKKRRNAMEKQRAEDNEKLSGPYDGATAPAEVTTAATAVAPMADRRASVQTTHTARTARTTETAPRLSLRPVTQFNPSFGERRSSKGAAMALALGSSNNTSTPVNRNVGRNPWDRPTTSQSQNENPFGSGAQRIDGSIEAQPSNPFTAPENVVGVASTTNSPEPSHIAQAVTTAGATLARKQSIRKDAPQALDLTKQAMVPYSPAQASPTGTEYSFTSVATGQSPGPSKSANAIAAAGGPASSTVHRVQLDFKPTLEDELEMRAGQLVRLLHEYDDGWALCIRLDRSQQGVVPRTCLSTRPVKPRPAGGPPGSRNVPPANPNGPPPDPNLIPDESPVTPKRPSDLRPGSPMRGPQIPVGPPQSPANMQRPESPGGLQMQPSQSPAASRIPRPQPPRPQSPAGMPRGQSPSGIPRPRNQSPGPRGPPGPYAGRSASSGPRSMSPGPRTQSPGPNRQRAYSQNSNNGMGGRRVSPPGPSPMNPAGNPSQYRRPSQGPVGRKPVPGQAY